MRLRTFLRLFRIYFFVIFIIMGLVTFIRFSAGGANEATVPAYEVTNAFGIFKFFTLLTLFLSFWLGTLSSLIDVFTLPKIVHKKPLWKVLIIGLIVQLAVIGIITKASMFLFTSIQASPSLLIGGSYYIGNSGQDQKLSETGLRLADARTRIWEVQGPPSPDS